VRKEEKRKGGGKRGRDKALPSSPGTATGGEREREREREGSRGFWKKGGELLSLKNRERKRVPSMQSYCPCKESHVGWGLNLPNTFLE
jgi:hypothetical protein